MAATLKKIAQYSGLSIATVSLTLNNKAVCPLTKAKVLKEAEKLQCRASALARSLRTQKTYTIGLTLGFPNLELIDAVVRAARARNYHFITLPCDQESLEYDTIRNGRLTRTA